MTLKFGTSGVRGLVTEMTDRACLLYARAFARVLGEAGAARVVSIAGDLRSSTPRIMNAVARGLIAEGFSVENCGFVSTPAVAFHAISRNQASIMVTGSHIPDDRNGIKFNMPWGEVLKAQEAEISKRLVELESAPPPDLGHFDVHGMFTGESDELGEPEDMARVGYVMRYLDAFPEKPFSGLKLVFAQHSTVCRDFFVEILESLGAEVIAVGRSETFVPVDTENIENPDQLAAWVREQGADALISADGDGDRPLVVDERGTIVRGDVLGILAASAIGADAVSAPVSCNTALEKSGLFTEMRRTKIGSPYVVEAMNEAIRDGRFGVVGFEANGGFLTGTAISLGGGASLTPLPTRDAVLPVLSLLLSAKQRGMSISALVGTLPARFTDSALLRNIPSERGKAFIARFENEGLALVREIFGETYGEPESMSFIDGARITFRSGDIIHLRPSGNAPEFRCYSESDSFGSAAKISIGALAMIQSMV